MNLADIQYTHILISGGGEFKGSITTVTKDIVAMMAASKKRKPHPSLDIDRDQNTKRKMHPPSFPITRTPTASNIKLLLL